MVETLNEKDILEKNQQVDTAQLQDVAEMLRQLQKLGIKAREYSLAIPFTQRHPKARVDEGEKASAHKSGAW